MLKAALALVLILGLTYAGFMVHQRTTQEHQKCVSAILSAHGEPQPGRSVSASLLARAEAEC
jgi:hypothetical protein